LTPSGSSIHLHTNSTQNTEDGTHITTTGGKEKNSGVKIIDLLLRIIFYVFLTTVMTIWNSPYVVASKFLESLYEKYKSVQSFKPHFLQNSPFVSDFKGVGNIPGSHFMKDFSALVSHSS
jgi:hypothetical protein